jgi:glutamine phosphoribosylpyrophosphate amidotransferase
VHVRVSAPPFLNPCWYGTDIDSRDDLIACRSTVKEIAEEIGADSLGYLSVEHVKMLARRRPRNLLHGLLYRRIPNGGAQPDAQKPV